MTFIRGFLSFDILELVYRTLVVIPLNALYEKATEKVKTINVAMLPKGIYLLSVNSGNGFLTKKIIVE